MNTMNRHGFLTKYICGVYIYFLSLMCVFKEQRLQMPHGETDQSGRNIQLRDRETTK